MKAIRRRRLTKKGDTVMKRITAIALLAIANLALAGTSFAQSNGVQSNVPFDFTVGNKVLPAGTYQVTTQPGGYIVIKNHDKPIAMLTLVDQDGTRSKNGGEMIFHKYGDQYFLSKILCDSADMNVELHRSKAEKQVLLQQAMVHPRSEVVIAAR
jgi:hypothetical protein